MKSSCLSTLFLLLAVPAWLSAQEAEKPAETPENEARSYTRFVETETGAHLDTAVAHYVNGDASVDLIGAVHIGDKAYYEKLNELFESYDVVLYEMVGDPERIEELTENESEEAAAPGEPVENADSAESVSEEGTPDGAESGKTTHPIMVLQQTMQRMLKLEHQVACIDYAAPNFVHADMSATKFDEEKKKKGETFLLLMIRSYKQQFKAMAEGDTSGQVDLLGLLGNMLKFDPATGLKLTFGRALEDSEAMIGGLEGEKGSVILTERNKFALGVLRKTLNEGVHRKIGIFYGAAHLPDMDERLRDEFGFQRAGFEWFKAWDIPKGK